MFSDRWICFCCPQNIKPHRSIVPIEEPQSRPPSQPKHKIKHKKSDVSKFFIIFSVCFIEIKILIILFIALAAVVIIQSWFRRRQATFEIRRKAAWTIYQNIEYAGEQDQLKVLI